MILTTKEYVDKQINKTEAVIKEITAHQTVNTYEVPTLVVQDIQDLYNATIAGKLAQISFDPSGLGIHSQFNVESANSVSGVAIRFVYNDTMILTYIISGDNVNITYKEIGTTLLVEKTYSELKTLRDNNQLVPGQLYRITDYVTTTTQSNTQSANHPFDLIVLATSTNTLSEEAKAIQHSGDTYFANENLNAWKVMYCLDNDTNRFEWADTTNGKGVIWHLIDEHNNSLWYDFKNIQSKNTKTMDRFYFTFDDSGVDSSLTNNSVFSNVFGNYVNEDNKLQLPQNIFIGTYIYHNTIGNAFYDNTIGDVFYYNTIGNQFLSNTIGNYFLRNTIGNAFRTNTIGNDFGSNTIGNYFYSNKFSSTSYTIEYCNIDPDINNKTFTKSYSNTHLYLKQEQIS